MGRAQSQRRVKFDTMAELSTIITHLDTLLATREFSDAAFNGLQVQGTPSVSTVAVAVDSGASVIERSIAAKAHLLIVHHGLLWGEEHPITGSHGAKIARLLTAGCSLYAAHLPLDAHPEVGNNALLAKFFDLTLGSMFAEVGGKSIGVLAHAAAPRTIDFFQERAKSLPGFGPCLALPFGRPEIRSVGIVSGSGSSRIEEAAARGVDLFISGEPKHAVYHQCKELGMNALFAGHYATETLGVRALGDLLRTIFGVQVIFIDEPTGI
ncbi:MAG: Nif3-like dinuclear metal center hexameric protein [Proteobacteria bacterium]|nr:Nif3-like dinuclear metal center hexameric protein [Pseudomonadota bacterium]